MSPRFSLLRPALCVLLVVAPGVLSVREYTGPYPETKRGSDPVVEVPPCTLDCANGGYCTFVTSDDVTVAHIAAAGEMLQKCVCQPGYAGLTCATTIEECRLPQRTCFNGAPCAQYPHMQEEWMCDCSFAEAKSNFAGEMCRNPATSYCGGGDFKNRSFCTNGGLCLSNLKGIATAFKTDELDTHEGCKCPPEFEGDHCEYLIGMPKISLYVPEPDETWELGIFSKIGLSAVVAAAIVVAAAMLYLRRRRRGFAAGSDQERSDGNLSRSGVYSDDAGRRQQHREDNIEFVCDDDDFDDLSVVDEQETDEALQEIESNHGRRRAIV